MKDSAPDSNPVCAGAPVCVCDCPMYISRTGYPIDFALGVRVAKDLWECKTEFEFGSHKLCNMAADKRRVRLALHLFATGLADEQLKHTAAKFIPLRPYTVFA